MKLDIRTFRYLSTEDWSVLAAVEQGSKNHEVVPTPLIITLSHLRGGASSAHKSISTLAKANLIAREKNIKYDGYRLTYGGLDYLALHAHTKAGAINSLGSQMGVGKESDIYLVTTPSPSGAGEEQAILKLHRLGRTSFRSLRTNRNYAPNSHASWHRLSTLSARREFAAMRTLREAGFRVPRPIGVSRHAVVMGLVPGTPLRAVPLGAFGEAADEEREKRVGTLYADCMELILTLAAAGVIHGDFNEFNILIENAEPQEDDLDEPEATAQEEERRPLIPHLIDLPQITSLSHPQASSYFCRDVDCIKTFFRKRYHFESDSIGPTFEDAQARLVEAGKRREKRLDVEIGAAGFSKKQVRELEAYYSLDTEHEGDEGREEEESEGTSEADGLVMDGDGIEDGALRNGDSLHAESIDKANEITSDIRRPGHGEWDAIQAESAENTVTPQDRLENLSKQVDELSMLQASLPKAKAATGWSI